jgi:hypothetical protein
VNGRDPGYPRSQRPETAAGGGPPAEQEAAEALRRAVASQFGRSLHIRTLDTGSCAAF